PLCPPLAGMGRAPLSPTPSHHPLGCRLLGLETHPTFSMPLWEPWRLSPGTPNDRRTAPACLPPGQPKNWASAPPSNASLAVSSSFFTCNGLLIRDGLPSSRRSLSPIPPP